jgi:multiple sugar transport system permease protein
MRGGASWKQIHFHVVLMALSVLFSLPFVWMISTSIKADDEIVHDPMVWIPEMPDRVIQSPYLDLEEHPPRWRCPPTFPEGKDWEPFCDQLRDAVWKRAQTYFQSPEWPLEKDPVEPALFTRARRDIEDSIWMACEPRLAETDWERSKTIELFAGRVTLEDVVKAWQHLYRVIEIGSVHLRNASAKDIGAGQPPPKSRISYSISGRSPFTEIARAEIALTSPGETLDQVMVRLKGDASYHRLVAKLEYDGKGFRTASPAFLSVGEYQDFFWKFTPQRKYEVEHLTFVHDPNIMTDIRPGRARMTLYLMPTPYWLALWERTTRNYQEVFRWVPYGTYTWVTVKITFFNILGQLMACSLVGFAFARLSFPGRDFLFVLMLATMMLPPQVTMIPQFVLFSRLGMYNTLFPLTIMSFTGAPFYIFLLRQFYMTIPQDLTDAAKIDGCGYFTTYWRIMLPLIKPALAAVAIFQFQSSWNEFLQPLIYITDQEKTPMSVGLFMFRQAQQGQWSELMAASAMMTIPIIILFFFTQRYFVQGVTMTGLKG